jgi:hypothetical protein
MAATETESKPTPAYASFKTVESFVQRLKDTIVPPVIDRSMLHHLSGATQNQLVPSLRFLGLIDAEDRVQPILKELVAARGSNDWATVLAKVMRQAYGPIVSSVDLEAGTAMQLQQAFKTHGGVDGATRDRCMRFFIAGMQEAGVKLSPLFTQRRTRRPRQPNNGTAQPRPKKPKSQEPKVTPPPTGTLSYPIGEERFMHLPIDLTDDDCDAIEAAMPLLRTIAKMPKGGAP